MEDLASEFQADFLDAVKVLEDFSSSDGDLRDALQRIRTRVEQKVYSCAPNFWEDLRATLGALEQKRDEGVAKGKVTQVLKQIARLEVKFWAKESLDMLRELDPESRLERMVEWINTFEPTESSEVSSSPAVLYQVLNDLSMQKDMEPQHRESLNVAVRENLHKFPVSMQGMLERVGSITGGGVVQLSDWRRRNQPASVEAEPELGPGAAKLEQLMAAHKAATEETSLAPGGEHWGSVSTFCGTIDQIPPVFDCSMPASGRPAAAGAEDEDEDIAGHKQISKADVDPEVFERARRAVLAVLGSNGGSCRRHHVRTLLKQAGLVGLPIAALGEDIFFSSADVFLRRPTVVPAAAAAAESAPLAPGKLPVAAELKERMVDFVRGAGGRLPLQQLVDLMQWQVAGPRHTSHGPLRRVLSQVPELFFEPQRVFTADAAYAQISVMGIGTVDAAGQDDSEGKEQPATQQLPYVADAFAQLISTILMWLQQADGTLSQDEVLPLIKLLGFKTRMVISALSKDVFWSHPEAECEILLRTASGALKHPKPLPDVYLHQQVHQQIIATVRSMNSKAKLDKLAGYMGWNNKSELRKTYGALRAVMERLREVWYDPHRLYLKRCLEGIVEWPVNREGRLGPGSREVPTPEPHWTPAADDHKAAGDPVWVNAKRQIIGAILQRGGQCPVDSLRGLLASLAQIPDEEDAACGFDATLEELFHQGGPRDLSSVLYWGHNEVRAFTEKADQTIESDGQVGHLLRRTLLDALHSRGPLSVEALLEVAVEAVPNENFDAESLCSILPSIPNIFFRPDLVFMKRCVNACTIGVPTLPLAVEQGVPPGAELEAEGTPAGLGDASNNEAIVGAPRGAGNFFNFSEFTSETVVAASPPPKRLRRDEDAICTEGTSKLLAAWEDAPPWVTEGALVLIRNDGNDEATVEATIIRSVGTFCIVRVKGSADGDEQRLPTPRLLPVAPKVGAKVKVVGGDRAGCFGSLVGLAGDKAVVQIGMMSYETLPMHQLAVVVG